MPLPFVFFLSCFFSSSRSFLSAPCRKQRHCGTENILETVLQLISVFDSSSTETRKTLFIFPLVPLSSPCHRRPWFQWTLGEWVCCWSCCCSCMCRSGFSEASLWPPSVTRSRCWGSSQRQTPDTETGYRCIIRKEGLVWIKCNDLKLSWSDETRVKRSCVTETTHAVWTVYKL